MQYVLFTLGKHLASITREVPLKISTVLNYLVKYVSLCLFYIAPLLKWAREESSLYRVREKEKTLNLILWSVFPPHSITLYTTHLPVYY